MKSLFKKIKLFLKRTFKEQKEEIDSAYIKKYKNVRMETSIYSFCEINAKADLARFRARILNLLYLSLYLFMLQIFRFFYGLKIIIIPDVLLASLFMVTYLISFIKRNYKYFLNSHLANFRAFEIKASEELFEKTVQDEIDNMITDIENK